MIEVFDIFFKNETLQTFERETQLLMISVSLKTIEFLIGHQSINLVL